MKNYPSDIDFGFIKQFISTIPAQSFVEDSESISKNSAQDLVNYNYDTLLTDLMLDINCKVFDADKKTKFERKDLESFIYSSLNTDRLQKNNILLSSGLWMQATTSPKINISNNSFQRSVDEYLKRLNFSEISASVDTKNQTISYPTLTTVQFDFKKLSQDEAKTVSDVSKFYFDKLFSKCVDDKTPQAIYNAAALSQDFSIHKYYLPNGANSSQQDDACLLFRYDHCPFKHKNGSMPPLYKSVYPESVSEPHFHFTSGFGSVYKLTNKNEENTFGVGYAIGVSGLKDYLEKILYGNYSSQKEEELYSENDFGMPFLSMLKEERVQELVQVYDELYSLQEAYENKDLELELATAYNISNTISSTQKKDLVFLQNANQDPLPLSNDFNPNIFDDNFSQ